MAYCANCGTQVADDVKFCPSCGKNVAGPAPSGQPGQAPPVAPQGQPVYQQPASPQGPPIYQQPVMPGAPSQEELNDATQNKGMAIVAYLLFFVPLLTGAHKTSEFVKYHVNQGLNLFIVMAVYNIISQILQAVIKVESYWVGIPVRVTPGWLVTILTIGSIALLIFAVIGIVNVSNGKKAPLPAIGGLFNFIK